MVVESRVSLYGEALHIPGFVKVLKTEYDEHDHVFRLVIGYNVDKISEIHRIRVGVAWPASVYWPLGTMRLRDGWQHVFYEHNVLRNGSWISIDPPTE